MLSRKKKNSKQSHVRVHSRKTKQVSTIPPVNTESQESTIQATPTSSKAKLPIWIQTKDAFLKFVHMWSKGEKWANTKYPVTVLILTGIIVAALFQSHSSSTPHESKSVEPMQSVSITVPHDSNYVSAPLLMPLSTRSGPSVKYDESGGFFSGDWKQQTVRVLGKSWDEGGNIWWVLIDFKYDDQAQYRVWTGIKRVDVDPAQLIDVRPLGKGTVHFTSDTYRGPGGRYARANINITDTTDVWIYSRENGYLEIEFVQNGQMYRLWVPESQVFVL